MAEAITSATPDFAPPRSPSAPPACSPLAAVGDRRLPVRRARPRRRPTANAAAAAGGRPARIDDDDRQPAASGCGRIRTITKAGSCSAWPIATASASPRPSRPSAGRWSWSRDNADYHRLSRRGAAARRAATTPPPEAERLFRRALELAARQSRRRAIYLATLKDMRGDHRGAVDELIALLREAPAGAPWEPQVREAVDRRSPQRNNIDIAGRLPPPRQPRRPRPRPPPSPARPASRWRRRAASRRASRTRWCSGMVDRLASRLRQNPRDADGWIRLMRSRMVLNEPAAAPRGAALRPRRLPGRRRHPAAPAHRGQRARRAGGPTLRLVHEQARRQFTVLTADDRGSGNPDRLDAAVLAGWRRACRAAAGRGRSRAPRAGRRRRPG